MNMRSSKFRALILAFGLFSLFSLLVFVYFRIQIVEQAFWKKKARSQHYFTIQEPGDRGTFWSNTSIKPGHPEVAQKLATDIRKYHLYIDPQGLPEEDKHEIAQNLLALSSPTEVEMRRFMEQFSKKSRSRKLVSWMDEAKKKRIGSWWYPYAKAHKIASNAVYFVPDNLRSHPFGKLLGQVLHTVQMQKDEKTHKFLPTGGLEFSCNKYLSGKPGKRRLMRSPRHSLELQQLIVEPERGADVYLTINHVLQAIAEEELEKGVKACRAKAGWAVVMNPYTGEINAWAEYPFFFPDSYPMYFANPELMRAASAKSISDANEPGSIMKPITLAIALKANLERKKQNKPPIFSPTEKIDTSKGNFPGRGKKPIKDTHFHHYLNMYLGLQKSSNIYCATLIQRVVQNFGDSWYRNELQNTFGFGKKTNIELPGESNGMLPSPDKKHPNGKPEWSIPTPYSLAFGYNLQANSLQMLRAHAVIANGGYLVEPTLIKKVVKKYSDGTSEILLDHTLPERVASFPRVLDESVTLEVKKAMRFVTKPGGGAPSAEIWGYTEAGKTGTTMKLVNGRYTESSHVASFVGFSPVEKPAFVIVIGIDEPAVGFVPGKGLNHFGGTCSAPIFREIARRSLEYLGVPPDDPAGYPKKDPRYDPERADGIKEAEELKKLYEQWNGKRH
ncbi:MAG: penicillin-binding protein 2 [Chlamydiales bacterium]|nr:penicillin-binding protein 2 [Chlamydiales bacterium]